MVTMDTFHSSPTKILEEAEGYLRILEASLHRKSKFNNQFLMGISAMCIEKLYMYLLLKHNQIPAHHTPIGLYREARDYTDLPEHVINTTRLISSFESICSFDGFGYKTPSGDELRQITEGLLKMKLFLVNDVKKDNKREAPVG